MIRRTIGFAHVADLDSIADAEVRAVAQTMALNIGQKLIKEHREGSRAMMTLNKSLKRLFCNKL